MKEDEQGSLKDFIVEDKVQIVPVRCVIFSGCIGLLIVAFQDSTRHIPEALIYS